MPRARKRLIVSGNVQQTGYRVLVKTIARSLGIVGFVRNLEDETVEIVCEGEPRKLAQFIRHIERKGDPLSPMDINVASIIEASHPVEGGFERFKIEYDRGRTPEDKEQDAQNRLETMILGASLLQQEVRGVGKDVRDMHSDMNARFDHMAERYDDIADTLKVTVAHMERGAAPAGRTQTHRH